MRHTHLLRNTCVPLVVETLNNVEGPKKWTIDDSESAHRTGPRNTEISGPATVKRRDKTDLITDLVYRDKLQQTGISGANDLTRHQTSIRTAARKEGKVMYFKRRKLSMGPLQTTPEVAATFGGHHVPTNELHSQHQQ